MRRPTPRELAILLGLAAVYLLAARLGLFLATHHRNVSPVWPASGLAVAALYRLGFRFWPAIAVGAFVANLQVPTPLLASMGIAAGNTLEALAGAALLRFWLERSNLQSEQRATVGLAAAATLATLISASLGVLTLLTIGLSTDLAWTTWLTWWIGDALGVIVFAPAFALRPPADDPPARWLGPLALALTVACAAFAFQRYFLPLMVTYPLLGLLAARSPARVSHVFALVYGLFSVVVTAQEYGPFAHGELGVDLISLQLFVASVALLAVGLPALQRDGALGAAAPTLAIMLLVAGAATLAFERTDQVHDRERFNNLVEDTTETIVRRMAAYEDALRGGVSLFHASSSVERDEWRRYVETLGLGDRYPGVLGMGLILPVPRQDLAAFEELQRSSGAPTFTVHPVDQPSGLPPADLSYVISFIEPVEPNRAALGLDIGSERERRAAAELARSTGLPTVSRRIELVQDDKRGAGFLLYVPIDQGGHFFGWVYAPFLTEGFFGKAVGARGRELQLEIREGDRLDAAPVYSTFDDRFGPHGDGLEVRTTLRLGQHDFQVRWRRSPGFLLALDTADAWIMLVGALIALLLGSLVASWRTLRDRAEAIAAERTQELLASQAQFRSTFEGAPLGVGLVSLDQRWLDANPALCAILGCPLEAMLGRPVGEAIHVSEDGVIGDVTITRLLEGEPGPIVYARTIEQGAEMVHVQLHCNLLRDAFGAPLYFILQALDVSQRNRAEAALRQASARLQALFDASPVGILTFDADLNVELWNPACERLFGWTAAEVVGGPLPIVPDEQREQYRSATTKLRAIRGPMSQETRRQHKDGRLIDVSISGMPLREDGITFRGAMVVIVDISAAKAAEAELLAVNEALRAATRAKSEFLANMSHEIRTPLNAMMGLAGLLQTSPLEPTQRDYLATIVRSGDALLTVIDDILDFSKIEAGRLEIERAEFDLNSALTDVGTAFSTLGRERNIVLRLDVPYWPHLFVGDSARLRQVLNNLVSNAIKFSPDGGVVTLRAERCGERVKVEVLDQGIGIPPEALSRLFEAFTQADASITRRFGGTGLGLSICRRLVQLMGGEIGVDSAVGRGSRFWFSLPLAETSTSVVRLEPESVPTLAIEGSRPLRVLIVEDNPVNQKVAIAQVTHLGYVPQAVSSGLEALDVLRALPFDLILMDCQMPDMDGFETTRRIRASQTMPFCRIPIIAMTANALAGDRELCLAAGMNDYISKPTSISKLRETLARWTAHT